MTISAEELHEWFDYDPESGQFRWKKRSKHSKNRFVSGQIAGSINKATNRRLLWLSDRRINASRAAYLMVYGELPANALIDHIDGNTLNDRINNLRLASQAQNTWNRLQRKNSRLALGVSKDPHGKFKARIQVPDGTKFNLGTWNTEAEAHACYMGAAAILHGDFWIGKRLKITADL